MAEFSQDLTSKFDLDTQPHWLTVNVHLYPVDTPVALPSVGCGASSFTVPPGGSVTLFWFTQRADYLLLDGEVVPLRGSETVTLTETTTYKFQAVGPGGVTNQTVTITVSP